MKSMEIWVSGKTKSGGNNEFSNWGSLRVTRESFHGLGRDVFVCVCVWYLFPTENDNSI